MCGLFGIVYLQVSAWPDRARIQQSIDAVAHRGPDAKVIHTEPGLGLGHVRLSLVDISDRANQPMWDATRRYCLIYNGEVYNFTSLRRELEQAGVKFVTTSDTEVVLQCLIHHGEAALARFEGMFGLAFVDRKLGTTLLARDRFGMKPLYWSKCRVDGGEAMLFASEIKCFAPWMDLVPDISMLHAYLMKFGGPTSGRTFYENIISLKPGTRLLIKPGEPIDIAPFFELCEFLDEAEMDRLDRLSPTQVADEFQALIEAAVTSHLFADARVGAFCSGGVDSSLLVSMAARQNKDVAVFHANVKGSWSEYEPASALARHLKLEMFTVDVQEQDFVDMIPRVTQHYEYPFSYHRNCAPLLLVAELARERGVKGLLSGEGADELFLGYPWLGRKRLTDAYANSTAGLARMVRTIPGIGPILAPDRLGNFQHVRNLMNGREIADDVAQVAAAIARLEHHGRDQTIGWTLDYLHYHLRTLLHRNDTMGMAASIEARFPFLDHAVARFGVNLPGRFKLRKSPFVFEKAHPFVRDKWVVRKVADRFIPKNLSQRIKIGFWTTTFDRLEISADYFAGSRLCDVLKLSEKQLRHGLEESGSDMRLRLMLADVWVACVLDKEDASVTTSRLRQHVKIRSELANRRAAAQSA